MQFRATAILCASRPHGETATIIRMLSREHGLVAGYVAGGRGRRMRPVLIPGNLVDAQCAARSDHQLPSARLELITSRGPWLSEPLPAAAIGWVTALTAASLPERHPYPVLYDALAALIEAICAAPSARGWAPLLLSFETLLLRELGYGAASRRPESRDWAGLLRLFDSLGRDIARYLLAERRSDVMAARSMLRDRLARIEGEAKDKGIP